MPVGFAVMSLAPIWTILLSGAFLAGLGMGLFEGPLTALIVDLAPGSTAKWLNLLHFFFGLGALTGPPLIAIAFTQDLSWRVMYGALSIVGLTSAIPFIFIKTRPNSRPITHQRISMARIADSVLNPIVLMMAVVIALYVGIEVTLTVWLPSFFQLEHGYSRELAGLSVSIVWIGIVAGRIIAGSLIQWIHPLALLTISMSLAVPVALISSLANNSLVAMAGFGIIGFLVASAFPTAMAVAVSTDRSVAGGVTGFVLAISCIGGMALPPIIGAMASPFGLQTAIAMIAILCGVTAITAGRTILVFKHHSREETRPSHCDSSIG